MNDLVTPATRALSAEDALAIINRKADALKKAVAVSGTTIGTGGGEFHLPDGSTAEAVDLVILDVVFRNQYYDTPFVDGEFSAPKCQAVGREQDDLVPTDDVEDKQSDACLGCPKNEFGSAPNKKGKACQNQLLLAVAFPDPKIDDSVYMIRVSATAAKDAQKYIATQTELFGHPVKCITRFSLKRIKNYSIVQVKYNGDNPNFAQHAALLDDAERTLLGSTQTQEALPPPVVEKPASNGRAKVLGK